jgi:hypothetical protein
MTGIGILLFIIFLMLLLQILNGLLKQSYVEKRDLRLRRMHEVATEVRSIRMLGWYEFPIKKYTRNFICFF